MTGRNRRRPGLQQALAAVRHGDTLVVPKLDRLARSVPDARAIGDSLAAGGVRLSIGGTVYGCRHLQWPRGRRLKWPHLASVVVVLDLA
jgi:hypothetical protein